MKCAEHDVEIMLISHFNMISKNTVLNVNYTESCVYIEDMC